MKKVGVAILGLGVVGGGTYKILTEHREFYRTTQHVDLEVMCVLERDASRISALGVPKELVASNIFEVVSNPDVNVVVECIGGVAEAKGFVVDALNAGKTVVTSNKELICKYSHELERDAKRMNVGLYFEASCVGGVPIVRTLLDGVQSNRISSIQGIINGTTNYILTRMTKDGMSYADALAEAKRLGYAETDPSADVDGFDAAYKLSILSSLAFHTKVPFANVFREGIANISETDIGNAGDLGYTLKLLAVGKQTEHGIEVRVHPAFVKNSHPLAGVDGSFNAVYLTGDSVGEVMLYGKGAGELPTGSAIVSDIIYAATHDGPRYSTFKNNATAEKDVKFVSDFESAYYLRLTVSDRAGALAKITSIFAKNGISIVELLQKSGEEDKATVVIVTHTTHEEAVKAAVSRIDASNVAKVCSVIRVLS